MRLKEASPADARLCFSFSLESWPKLSQASLPEEWDWVSTSDSSDAEWEDLAERPSPSGEAVKSWRQVVLSQLSLPPSQRNGVQISKEVSRDDAANCVNEESYGRIDGTVNDDACSCHSSVWSKDSLEAEEAEEAYPRHSQNLAELNQLRGRAWNEGFKFRYLHGASATRRPKYRKDLRTSEVFRKTSNTQEGRVVFYPVTEMELELGLDQHNLNKNRAWERCADLFEETGTQTKKAQTQKDDLVEVSFSLPTVGFLVTRTPEPSQASKPGQRGFMLHEARRWDKRWRGLSHIGPLKPVCHLLCSQVPPDIAMPRLPARLSTRAATKFTFGKALLQNGNQQTHCWVPGPKRHCLEDSRDFLEVDLESECVVNAVGTRGLFPSYFWYPTDEMLEKEMKIEKSEYRGGYQAVVCADSPMGWVRRYELLYRLDRGKEWVSLGVFDGNTNYYEESVTSMLPFAFPGISGIRVRYLRFRPLSKKQEGYHMKKALRVAIYGYPVTKASANTQNRQVNYLSVSAKDTAEKSLPASSPSSDESATSVTYTLSHLTEHHNPTYVQKLGPSYRKYWDDYGNCGRKARKKIDLHTIREETERIGRVHLGVPVSLILNDPKYDEWDNSIEWKSQEDEADEEDVPREPGENTFASDADLKLAQVLSLSIYEHEKSLEQQEQAAFEMTLQLSRNEGRKY